MGCVKLTAKHAAAPPHAMDSRRFGLRTVDSAIVVVAVGIMISDIFVLLQRHYFITYGRYGMEVVRTEGRSRRQILVIKDF